MRPSVSSFSSAFVLSPSTGSRDSFRKRIQASWSSKGPGGEESFERKKVMMVVYWEKPFSAKKGKVQVPWRKEFLNQFSKKSSHHWLPSILEDYYGPRNHKPKHH
ncbi:hypothetical protein NC652_015814 [Populus alba x Populus x berolinensis]|nr:hypothetical protein NC652_015814 [Populus alba x Populus x berolinensis]